MARFFNPDDHGDGRLHAPATARNRDAILDVLMSVQPEAGTILEIASGTGEHAVHMAGHFPKHRWQPTDILSEHLTSIKAWRDLCDADNILAPFFFDALQPWPAAEEAGFPDDISMIVACNLIHIAPWSVAESLVRNAGDRLNAGGCLFLYGPYKRGGVHTAESNAAFDQSLQSRNSAWGVRDLEAVEALAKDAGFTDAQVIAMPANNLSVIFTKK